MRLAKRTMPKARKKTNNASSFADALKVCMRILKPGECLVNLKSRSTRAIERTSRYRLDSVKNSV